MVCVVYDSRNKSGTTKLFAERLAKSMGTKVYSVEDYQNNDVKDLFILCTYTIGCGEVPKTTEKFLDLFANKLTSVVANGSTNFINLGLYGKAGEIIATQYNVPLLKKIDMGGSLEDVEYVTNRASYILGIKVENKEKLSVGELSTYTNGIFQFKRLHTN